MTWTLCKNYPQETWIASRLTGDGVCDNIYVIYKTTDGYVAEMSNNAYGACRVAVKNTACTEQSSFENLDKLKKAIENKTILWLYISHCNCIGKICTEGGGNV